MISLPLRGSIAALALLASWPALAQVREIPDPELTPGVVADDGRDVANVCGMVNGLSYSKRHRQTPAGLKAVIMRRYGMVPGRAGDIEVDHRVPLALGGADVAYNLWAQPGDGHGARFTYHDKDALEVWAWRQVCHLHAMPLGEAQAIFLAPDWRPEFCRRVPDANCALRGDGR